MTASTKTIAATFLLALGLSSTSFAQQAYASNSVKSQDLNNTTTVDGNSSIRTVDAADPVIVTRFSALFPNATDLKWTSNADNFLVTFLTNGRKGNASFTAKAELNYVILDCNMEQLPVAFSKSIKKDYASYHLFNAKEIKAHGTVAYQAILEDSKGYITLKYNVDGIEVIQQVKKAGN